MNAALILLLTLPAQRPNHVNLEANLQPVLQKLESGQQVNFLVLGDSLSRKGWTQPFTGILQRAYGNGGSGYTEHFPASQYLRDARITMIYEGTNGIQALDLVGRKLPANGGRAIMSWFAEIDAFESENGGEGPIKPFIDGLADAKKKLQEATMWLM